MKNKIFWKRIRNSVGESEKRTLFFNGTIAEESRFDDDITPQIFKEELNKGVGDIDIRINSPGGDCIAAAQIYNMLSEYKGHITVKIDGIAASAASVIAMAGDEVLMSSVSMLMIHNPMTIAIGDHEEMNKAKEMLNSIKESIINAYEKKTNLNRKEISNLMDAETWMDVNKAIELGFCDSQFQREKIEDEIKIPSMMFSRRAVTNSLIGKMKKSYEDKKIYSNSYKQKINKGISVTEVLNRLNNIKNTWR